MRLIDRQIKSHPETFAPELVVTIAIPMHMTDKPNDVRKSYEQWGRDFLDIISGTKGKE